MSARTRARRRRHIDRRRFSVALLNQAAVVFAIHISFRRAGALAALMAAALATGCQHIPSDPPPSARRTLPAEMAAQFDASGPALREIGSTPLSGGGTIRATRHEFLAPEDEFGTNRILVDAYLPAGEGPWPVILIRPISGSWYLIEAHVAREFAAQGFAAVVMHRREPDQPPLTGVGINAFFRSTIIDSRRVLDWIEQRSEFDPRRIGFFGASEGGIEGAALTPVDPRLRASVLAFAAGDMADVYATTMHWRHVLKRNELLLERRITLEEMKAEFRLTFTCDPIRLAPYVDPARVLLMLARFDTAVPFKQGWALREAMGGVETYVLPAGHVFGFAAAPYVESKAVEFFQRKLGAPGSGGGLLPAR